MFPWGSRFLLALGVVSLGSAAFYGLLTGGEIIGVISAGYKGGIGDHFGYVTLLSFALVSILLGALGSVTQEGIDTDEKGVSLPVNQIELAGESVWPLVAAFGFACLAIGYVVDTAFLVLGVIVLLIVFMEWVLLSWSTRLSGDSSVNEAMRQRVIGPFQVPMFSMLGVAVLVVAVSRVLLAVPALGATIVAVVAATIIFFGAIFFAKRKVPTQLLSAAVVVGAITILAGGVVAAAVGERDFHHGEEHSESHSEDKVLVEGEGE